MCLHSLTLISINPAHPLWDKYKSLWSPPCQRLTVEVILDFCGLWPMVGLGELCLHTLTYKYSLLSTRNYPLVIYNHNILYPYLHKCLLSFNNSARVTFPSTVRYWRRLYSHHHVACLVHGLDCCFNAKWGYTCNLSRVVYVHVCLEGMYQVTIYSTSNRLWWCISGIIIDYCFSTDLQH